MLRQIGRWLRWPVRLAFVFDAALCKAASINAPRLVADHTHEHHPLELPPREWMIILWLIYGVLFTAMAFDSAREYVRKHEHALKPNSCLFIMLPRGCMAEYLF